MYIQVQKYIDIHHASQQIFNPSLFLNCALVFMWFLMKSLEKERALGWFYLYTLHLLRIHTKIICLEITYNLILCEKVFLVHN